MMLIDSQVKEESDYRNSDKIFWPHEIHCELGKH